MCCAFFSYHRSTDLSLIYLFVNAAIFKNFKPSLIFFRFYKSLFLNAILPHQDACCRRNSRRRRNYSRRPCEEGNQLLAAPYYWYFSLSRFPTHCFSPVFNSPSGGTHPLQHSVQEPFPISLPFAIQVQRFPQSFHFGFALPLLRSRQGRSGGRR